MLLCVTTSAIKDISYLGLFGEKVISVYLELSIDLEPLALKGKVLSICKK